MHAPRNDVTFALAVPLIPGAGTPGYVLSVGSPGLRHCEEICGPFREV